MIDDKNTSKIETARKKYNAYDSTMWIKIFFDENTGGYVVVDKERAKNSSDKTSNNENRKYAKELAMSIVFARNGYGIEMLREIPRVSSPDVNIDGIPGELKHIAGENNIVRNAHKAYKVQGAKIVLFQFDKDTEQVYLELLKLKREGYKILYFFSRKRKVHVL